MSFVLDCSVAVAWCFEDEASPDTDAVLDRLLGEGACVPPVWHLELANVLVMGERRGRIDSQASDLFLGDIARLPIETDDPLRPGLPGSVVSIAHKARLTAYDASYLELAIHRGYPLATRDNALAVAARAKNVPLVLP